MKIFFSIAVLVYSLFAYAVPDHQWTILKTIPYKGKQDDIFFINRHTGWYVNGKGFIYKTNDGGESWVQMVHQPGTFFRSIGFSDSQIGFAGNIGTDYFPDVSDKQPLYRTEDGGRSWTPVSVVAPEDIRGICAIDIKKMSYIDSGVLKTRTSIYAAGRVGGPAKLVVSRDNGATWKKYDLSKYTAMIQDVKFINESTGFVCAGSDANVEISNAQILKTVDGGVTWKVVYQSKRPLELIWKCDFPSTRVGYATVLNYDKTNEQKVVLKTIDSGETWQELPLAKDGNVKEFGVGFVDENRGWVGTGDGMWQTLDGGLSWQHQPVGHAINKIRVIKDEKGIVVYGIGVEVVKLGIDN